MVSQELYNDMLHYQGETDSMGYNASRLTLYAILSAIEDDLRNAICVHLDCGKPAREILGQYSEKIEERFEEEVKSRIDNPPLD